MLRKLEEFHYFRKKEKGNKPGAYYKDENGQEWLIKSLESLSSVEEAFSGALFKLFAGDEFSPDIALVIDNEGKLLAASKINPGYTQFDNVQMEESENKVVISGKPVAGLELVILISALLHERDFYGNGNVGFDLSAQEKSTHVPAFRIDFDDTFKSDRIKTLRGYNSLGEILEDLVANPMLIWRLYDKEKIKSAIEKISSVDNSDIDKIFQQFFPYFEIAVKAKIKEHQRQSDENHEMAFYYDKLVIELNNYIDKFRLSLEQLKTDKAQLARKLVKLSDANVTPSGFYLPSKELSNPLTDTFQKLKNFFSVYDGFYAAFRSDFSQRSAKKLIADTQKQGEACESFKEYIKMRQRLIKIIEEDERKLQYYTKYIEYVENNLISSPDYEDRHDKALKNIEILKKRVKQHVHFKEIIAEADISLQSIITPSQRYFHNSGNYAVVRDVRINDDQVVFTVNTSFPGSIFSEKENKYLDEGVWQQMLDFCDIAMQLSKANVERVTTPSGSFETVTYTINIKDAISVIENLKHLSDQFEPYAIHTFYDDIKSNLIKQSILNEAFSLK
ncbi:hypothetical protein AQUSIP_24640 [Aquicella siphonis]|uniref:Uncharacterized protein n=1 Tax=Aquicella siphonis TaxID=254247 RepID=A0A5E4PL79_9COXI|nr:hypothetical protein [Aquicella siphonis]VVC77137.1 hypothetical protein AQUSIP_24640 [Aquicella siphonis]